MGPDVLPPAPQVRVCTGPDSIIIRISDHGGGIPPELEEQVWSYGFSTIQHQAPGQQQQQAPDGTCGAAAGGSSDGGSGSLAGLLKDAQVGRGGGGGHMRMLPGSAA